MTSAATTHIRPITKAISKWNGSAFEIAAEQGFRAAQRFEEALDRSGEFPMRFGGSNEEPGNPSRRRKMSLRRMLGSANAAE
jgi:hypothetical protein